MENPAKAWLSCRCAILAGIVMLSRGEMPAYMSRHRRVNSRFLAQSVLTPVQIGVMLKLTRCFLMNQMRALVLVAPRLIPRLMEPAMTGQASNGN
jgi:hypothetical protein